MAAPPREYMEAHTFLATSTLQPDEVATWTADKKLQLRTMAKALVSRLNYNMDRLDGLKMFTGDTDEDTDGYSDGDLVDDPPLEYGDGVVTMGRETADCMTPKERDVKIILLEHAKKVTLENWRTLKDSKAAHARLAKEAKKVKDDAKKVNEPSSKRKNPDDETDKNGPPTSTSQRLM